MSRTIHKSRINYWLNVEKPKGGQRLFSMSILLLTGDDRGFCRFFPSVRLWKDEDKEEKENKVQKRGGSGSKQGKGKVNRKHHEMFTLYDTIEEKVFRVHLSQIKEFNGQEVRH